MRFYALLAFLCLAGVAYAQINDFSPFRIREYLKCPQDRTRQARTILDEFKSILQCPKVRIWRESIKVDVARAFRIINPNNDDKLTKEEADFVMNKFKLNQAENDFKFLACDGDEDGVLTLEEYELCSVVSYAALIVAADQNADNELSKIEMTSLIRNFATIVYTTITPGQQDAKIVGLGRKEEYTLADVVHVDTSLFQDFVETMRQPQKA